MVFNSGGWAGLGDAATQPWLSFGATLFIIRPFPARGGKQEVKRSVAARYAPRATHDGETRARTG